MRNEKDHPDGALPLFIGGATHEVRTEDKLVYTMSYEKEEDERSEINWDHVSGEGVRRKSYEKTEK